MEAQLVNRDGAIKISVNGEILEANDKTTRLFMIET